MADPILRRLVLYRFRSFPAEQVEFDNPTFLVGQNGSGKSNFADAFAFLAEAMASPLQAVLERRGGLATVGHRRSARSLPSNLGLAVVLDNPDDHTTRAQYAFVLRPMRGYGFEVVREQCVVQRSDGSGIGLIALRLPDVLPQAGKAPRIPWNRLWNRAPWPCAGRG